ncbi:MAG: peptidyl-prolyl cis-trans isomerase [Deltaproteobacteria bacterium]|nr:peptidyl-prolyl cis-trans isomerase [Deltaproteobacteria bacterium]
MIGLRSPGLRFVVLGAALLAAKHLLLPDLGARRPLVLTQGRMAQLQAAFQRSTGRLPGPADERVLLDRAIDDEVLYREAISLGLDQNDTSIAFRLTEKMRFLEEGPESDDPIDDELDRRARRLGLHENDAIVRRIAVQKMRLLLARGADGSPPAEAELRAHYERHRDEYGQAARVGFWHVFLGSAAGHDAEREAATLLERLRRRTTPPTRIRLGRPFPLGTHVPPQSARELESFFGEEFARSIWTLEAARWQGPLRSAHGLHLVWIDEKRASQVASFDAVRSRVVAELEAERRDSHLREGLASLRDRYVVRVEEP